MNKQAFSIAAAIVVALSVAATENIGYSGKTAIGYKDIAATCNPASAQIDLDINNVRTTLLNGGDLWWDLNDARYEVPKIEPPGSAPSIHALFAGAIWMGGIDAGNQLKIAAQTYRQSGNDFWPGPLDATGSIELADCNEYNRFWKVNGSDIDDLIACTIANGGTCPEGQIPASILEWPAKGNFRAKGALGNFLTINDDLAPFFDYDGDGLYDPTLGDYPVINSEGQATIVEQGIYADQMIFWVYNDKGNIHTETGGQAIGIQVNALAFAFATSDEVNDMTFYRYKLINKANININNFYMAQWVDADLGCFLNDYVGCDTVRDLGICYNGTSVDADCATRGYGVDPPLVGMDFFEGPLSDPDANGVRTQLGMAAFTYYNNDQSVNGNPQTAVHFYNYMTSKWTDNTPFTSDECTGYGGTVPAKFMFPSPPPLTPFPQFWSECSCNNTAADRRFLQSSGPFTLEPGAVNNITVGAIWVRPTGVYPCPDFETSIGPASDKAQALFDNGFKLVDGPDAPDLVIRELDKQVIISFFNGPASNNVGESYNETDPVARANWETDPTATDTTYKFQGYILYQLKNAQVSVQDLNDVNNARIVAQVDVEDGITKIVNFTFDAGLGADVPELKVDGNNEGIRRTFSITEDLFATGSKTLVNHKNYYFAVVAYAYNNYDDYDPLRAFEGGQKTPYLQGRRNYKVYSAIPHMWEAARGGTDMTARYGDGVEITRIEGKGNGGLTLDLTQESIDNIMNSPTHFFGPIVYKENSGPIDVKVYDPMKLKAAEFVFTMIDSGVHPVWIRGNLDTTSYISTEATWKLEIYPMNQNDPFELIISDRNIEEANEQLISNYGISIRLNQVGLPGKAADDFPSQQDVAGFIAANGFIEATIEFQNAENRWFTGVNDEGTFGSQNWIRAGQYTGGENDQYLNFFDDHNFPSDTSNTGRPPILIFYDPAGVYGNVLGATWAPYGLAANWVNTDAEFLEIIRQSGINGGRPFSYGPAFPWKHRKTFSPSSNFAITENCLHNLQGVDLVLTSDKSKWTRCVVVELGEDNTLTEGGANKGQIRQHISWDKSGNYIASDTGRSWFPGYAINVESGERLNILFGEDSWLIGENGRDMIWNPTSTIFNPVPGSEPLFGGKHYIYITDTKYDEGAEFQRSMLDSFNLYRALTGGAGTNPFIETYLNSSVYSHIMWTSMSLIAPGYKFKSLEDGFIPTETKIRLRVNVPYGRFTVDGSNGGVPKYAFSTDGIGTELNVVEVAKDACDQIRAVPNPYYAYSSYETGQLDNRVKITNLPDNCTVTIYTINGTLIRQFTRAVSGDISDGASTEFLNLDNTLDWDLKNNKDIPVASGLYLIHIKADGVCEKVVKWFGVLRPIDLDTF